MMVTNGHALSLMIRGFLLDFEIDFNHAAIAATEQTTQLDFNTANFAAEVGQARTFGFLKDIEYLQKIIWHWAVAWIMLSYLMRILWSIKMAYAIPMNLSAIKC